MKTMKCLTAATLLLIAGSVSAETWTSIVGSKIDAEFVKEKNGTVYLKTVDGKIKKIKLADLSEESRELAKRLASPFAGTDAEKKPGEKVAKAPDAIYKLFGKELRNNRKKKVSVDELNGKVIGIYFSAHWCGPCRAFTPDLVEFHKEMTKKEKPFEIVFVSSDRDKKAMYDYMEEMDMPWLALPFGDDHKEELAKKYKVSGIPKLVIIDAEGNTITTDGRGQVSREGASAYKGWK